MNAAVDLVYFDAGGGHRAAAQALADVVRQQHRPWDVRLVNLPEAIDPARRFRRWTGIAPEDLYNARLRRGWTFGMSAELKLLQAGIRALHRPLERRLSAHWSRTRPDLVVSLIPNFNRTMALALRNARPEVPFVTVMTDLADLPPSFWIEPSVEQHIVCGTPRAVRQAMSAGVPAGRIHAVTGMVLRPDFYGVDLQDRAARLSALGLHAGRPVAAVMYGGHGSAEMLRIARALPRLQLILFTGHNATLAAQLRANAAAASHAPRAVVGFTPNVAELLSLADFFIGKPGPGCLSEALRLGLPVLTFETRRTLPQERYNTTWVRENGVGLVVRSIDELPAASDRLLARLPDLRRRVSQMDNQAVFEVPELLASLLWAGPRRVPSGRGLGPLCRTPAAA